MADVTGEQTGTAAISFGEQLKEFFASRGSPLAGAQAIAALQRNPALANQFLAGATFEKKSLASIRELLLNRNSGTASYFAQNLAKFGNADSLRAQAADQLRQLGSGAVEQNAAVNRAFAATQEQLANEDLPGGQGGAIRDQLVAALQQAGQGAFASQISKLQFEFGTGVGRRNALNKAVELIEARRQQLLYPTEYVDFGEAGGATVPRNPTPLETKQAASLGRLEINITNIANQNNLNNDGTSRTTELIGRDDLP
ncbi:MAG: hypothetical protein GC162_10355 [Planctomycetes bacterium]|nr:hypothetical protein [Planctomycetota bacterium]